MIQSEKVAVPESKYYTVEGTSTATLPGTYHVKVTLNEGYFWTDGTTDPVEFDWTIKALQTEKPVAISVLTYNGEFQTGVKAGTGYNLAGTYTAKDAGTYNAKVLLADGYEWSDGTTDALTLTWSIAKKAVAKPSAAKNLVYNGKSQTGVAVGEGYTVTGNAQTDAGDYTAVAALNKNYAWGRRHYRFCKSGMEHCKESSSEAVRSSKPCLHRQSPNRRYRRRGLHRNRKHPDKRWHLRSSCKP